MDGCLRVVVAEERSQWQNRQKALHRMAELLREGLQPPPPSRKSTRPGRGAVKESSASKKGNVAISSGNAATGQQSMRIDW